MKVQPAPESALCLLTGYPHEPNFATVGDFEGVPLRMHYVREGPRDGRPVVLIPGPPTWSYMFREAIPVLTEAGCRVVAVDLIGLGRSDKIADVSAYTMETWARWMNRLLEVVDVRNSIVVAHGLSAQFNFSEARERIARLVVCNPGIPRPDSGLMRYFQHSSDPQVSGAIQAEVEADVHTEILAAYDAPHGEPSHRVAVWKSAQILRDPTHIFVPSCRDFGTAQTPFAVGRAMTNRGDAKAEEGLAEDRSGNSEWVRGTGYFLPHQRGPELAHAVLALAARF